MKFAILDIGIASAVKVEDHIKVLALYTTRTGNMQTHTHFAWVYACVCPYPTQRSIPCG